MIGCEDLGRLLDRTLSDEEHAAMEEHIEQCDSCRTELAEWNDVEAILRADLEDDWAPTPFDASRLVVLARERQEKSTGFSWTLTNPLVWAPVTAAAVAVFGVAFIAGETPTGDPVVVADAQNADETPTEVEAPAKSPSARDEGAEQLAARPAGERETSEETPASAARKLSTPGKSTPRTIAVLHGAASAIQTSKKITGTVVKAPKNDRVLLDLGGDRVALARGSQGHVIEATRERTRIRVTRGTMVFDVRHRGPNDVFEVEAAEHLVQVVGTRFSVTVGANNGVAVHVDDGIVRVVPPNTLPTLLEKGEDYRFGMPKRRKSLSKGVLKGLANESGEDQIQELIDLAQDGGREATAADSAEERRRRQREKTLSTWRGWIENRNFEAVTVTVEAHLSSTPRDADAWEILADAQRLNGNWDRAVDAYRNVIKFGRGRQANDARFEAATILSERMGKHEQAVTLFKAYLKQKSKDRAKEPQAMIRMAKSWRAMGKTDVAMELLRTVVIRYKQTPAGTEARYLLRQWSME